MRLAGEDRGEYLRRKRVVLSDFTICLEFPTAEEAEHAARILEQVAVHKKYRDRDRVVVSGTRVCLTYAPGAYINEYPRSFIADVVDRIYESLNIAYRRWGSDA